MIFIDAMGSDSAQLFHDEFFAIAKVAELNPDKDVTYTYEGPSDDGDAIFHAITTEPANVEPEKRYVLNDDGVLIGLEHYAAANDEWLPVEFDSETWVEAGTAVPEPVKRRDAIELITQFADRYAAAELDNERSRQAYREARAILIALKG